MKSILFIQNGDYKDAYLRFADGGDETYRDQRRSVDWVASFAPENICTTVALTPSNYRQELADNLWAVGIRRAEVTKSSVKRIFDEAKPTHVVLRTPHLKFLREARRRGVFLLPCFADIFGRGGPRTTLKNAMLRKEIKNSRARCYSNHSLNASRSMVNVLKLKPEMVVPWDWQMVPLAKGAKTSPVDVRNPTAFFAGTLTESKGVGDCIRAISELSKRGVSLSMNFAGPGDTKKWRKLSDELGVSSQTAFLGMISNSAVRKQMNEHDFVIVPSRHDYAEGLPNTIYEGLASRSVVIISDHPAFSGRLLENEEVLIFKAGNPSDLASSILAALEDTSLYMTISGNSGKAHDKLYVGLEWSDLVNSFLNDPEDTQGWVRQSSLANGK